MSVVVFVAALGVTSPLTGGAQAAVTESFATGPSSFVVPPGVTALQVHAVGGQGGRGYFNSSFGGRAAVIEGTLAATPADTLHLYVAGNGRQCGGGNDGAGYNGGGRPSLNNCVFDGGGGGASDIRTTSGDLGTRLLVAGGGGGAGDYGNGADAGAGAGPSQDSWACLPSAQPGTADAGGAGGAACGANPIAGTAGSFGQGGDAGYRTDNVGNVENSGGGGGGGWYGGGGGTVYGGGAGGSSHTTAAVSGTQPSLAALGSTPVITLTYPGLMLNVGTDGNGSGFVDAPGVSSTSPTALDCGRNTPGTHTACAKEYRPGTSVTLTAHSDATTSTFGGFSGGGCSGTEPCVVTIDQVRDVTATFALAQRALDVAATGTGAGYVDSLPTGLDCGRNVTGHDECGASFSHGTSVTLTAHPDTATSTFEGFSGGGCSGTEPCVATMDQARNVTATFTATPQATIAVDPSSADLGSVLLGETSDARTFTVTNTSSGMTAGPLVLDSAVVSGAGFALADDECSDTTVAPGDTCTFAATFAPTVSGAAAGTVSLPGNATGSPATIALSATGTVPAPPVVPPSPPTPLPPVPPTPPLEPVVPVAPVATVMPSKPTVTRCMDTAKGTRRNVAVNYTVSAPSRITFTLQRRVRTANGAPSSCPKPQAPGTRSGEYVTVRGAAGRGGRARVAAAKTRALSTTVSVAAGPHRFALKTLLGATKLRPGRYRVLVEAVSTATGSKARSSAYFWVLKQRKQ